ncbi:MAG: acetate kinase, partial [Candidatus Omnitrophica bacterium]|nr:acetate kinase [Candidatus Omnitrophota bacterium]
FHQSIPEQAFMYPLPISYYKRYKIRKYGFHGTSHQFVANQAAKVLGKPLDKLRLITCHLGNGCSLAAIDRGKSIDTSMGFTPLEGLMMGTRSGDVDVAAIFYLMKKEKLSISAMDDILNKKSGILGVFGLSNDFRVLSKSVKRGNRRAMLAYEMFVYRLKKYIGAYYFILGQPDAVCITGGIGEHSSKLVNIIKNDISKVYNGRTKVLIIPTDEELMIANLTYELVCSKLKGKVSK